MISASEVLGGLPFSKAPSGYREADGTDAFCFRNALWRLKGWPYEEGPEWDRFPDWIDNDDIQHVLQRAELAAIWLDEDGAFEQLSQEPHPGMAVFHLRQRADGREAAHVEYAFSIPLISRYWNTSGGLPLGSPGWPLRRGYLERFDVTLDAVVVDRTQQLHKPSDHPPYHPSR
jgi:hypothetical protein